MKPSPRPGEPEADLLELVSAFADGQPGTDAYGPGAGMARILAENSARSAWSRYHLIGDVMRSADLALPVGKRAAVGSFCDSVMARIAQEPALVAAETVPLRVEAAANDAWGWKLVAGCASVGMVAVLAWGHLPPGSAVTDQVNAQAQAQSTAPVVVQAAAPASPEVASLMIRDPHLDELLAAHRQFGGTSALQAPAGFLRNAAFEGPGR